MKTSRYVVLGIAGVAGILLFFLVHGMMSGKERRVLQPWLRWPHPAGPDRARADRRPRYQERAHAWPTPTCNGRTGPSNTLNPAYIIDGHGRAPTAAGSEEAARKAGGVQALAVAASDAARHALTPGAKESYIGGVARQDILANTPITDTQVVRADEGGFMAVMLEPGMRALAVEVSVDNTAGGFILPGDHVDIMASLHQTPKVGGGTNDSVETVLHAIFASWRSTQRGPDPKGQAERHRRHRDAGRSARATARL